MRRPVPIPPGPHQESVWDYPRPPRLEASPRHLVVRVNGRTVAETHRSMRVLETSHPPVYYFPPSDVQQSLLVPDASQGSACEWKGRARYFDIAIDGRHCARAAWSYPAPDDAFRPIQGWIAFYAGRVDECRVDGVVVRPQPGGFYGGWITPDVVGPFKGIPGSWGW
ncbi:MAG: DUF427 domain-containing protein [Myxococcota bacterium]|nr:DUF427 domain-containing protein [Myxococcota bacterium]